MKNRISLIIAFTILVWSVTYLPYENANGSVVSDVAPLLQGNVHQKNQILFQDDYSSGAGWTQIGTTVTVNSPSFPGVVYFNNAQGGVSSIEERVYKQLPTTLPAHKWSADFTYEYTASSIPTFRIFALTPSNNDPQDQSTTIQIVHGNFAGDNQLAAWVGPAGTATPGIPISANTQYYVTLEKNNNLLTLKIFSDSGRTQQIAGSPAALDIKGMDFSNLNYLQHDGCKYCGESRSITAQIDNMIIFAH